ncbi:hypothetical protein CCM_00723 [Cordyceps militaris CM01]|uniref:Uncharacterized protein n=1 Tax=Cordyceps militaris (strain CM01) TaxID=983644 RepID=G3J5R1_CORMM|nr:uncharacterized protein CCM_00723 [Cordyceps militaris CM01]EGX96068.1 hypothetical protein CCM_00723 [Cordyceps militaris CM01]
MPRLVCWGWGRGALKRLFISGEPLSWLLEYVRIQTDELSSLSSMATARRTDVYFGPILAVAVAVAVLRQLATKRMLRC